MRRTRGIARAAAAAMAVGATLVAHSSEATSRCSEAVCLELAVPPHVSALRRGELLECLLVLPGPADGPVDVKIVLRTESEPRRCFCQYETLPRGSTWKRALLLLGPAMPPGVYGIGVSPTSHGEASLAECDCAEDAASTRFLVRRLAVAP